MARDFKYADAKKVASQKAKKKYFLKHSTALTRETRVYNSVIKNVIFYYKKGFRDYEIAKKIRKPRQLVALVKRKFLFLREPIKKLDFMLPKNTYQEYNKHGVVSCRCGKFFPVESSHYCAETIKNQ